MARTVALVLVLPACLFKPARPNELCGDSLIQPDEQCDDGNAAAGDGCSAACQIEPWFRCLAAGALCHPILELQWTEPGNVLPGIGGKGGGDFDDDCATLVGSSARRTVVVGFEGGADPDGSSLTDLRAICADVELRGNGGIRWSNPLPTQSHGNTSAMPVAVQMCDDDEVATGFVGSSGGVVSGFQLACQAITHTTGTLALGAANRLPAIGPNNLSPQMPQSCGPNEIARAVVGKAGAVIDRLSLRCVPTTLVVCGDGLVVEPETCDDGNASPGDGCNATCDGDSP